MAPSRPPIPPSQRPLPSEIPPVTQHQQLYNPDAGRPPFEPTKPVLPPNLLVNPLTGAEVMYFEEAILLYQAADIFYTGMGQMTRNMTFYGPISMVCKSAVVAMHAARQARRPLKPVLDEWFERLEKEKEIIGFGKKT